MVQEQLVLFGLCQYTPSPSEGIYVKWRQKIFTEHQIPYARELSDALLANPNPKQPTHGLLTAGDYGIIVDGG